ncbi:MerR family DNA-binding transcriptional regulator [Chelatococcus sp. SYSU_G07232]|uniref:MerR family DNA-binding transcriptional regulator n=1 Tax=Chelatococcus albus TaxID=3047466 RepID=A0ABT7AJH2_9HYPH|nr:MerR family DNA-binding transcriptional regulator [Chelatococcus sp. SYSU_G07232]MDJ1159514.1 MerR family DNA-binding transcriptional regulator [Chelatococcus sp. SYSU_G07232]
MHGSFSGLAARSRVACAAARSDNGFHISVITTTRGPSIGQLAAAAGIDLETVRYYERIGLMPAPPRTSGGHRACEPEHLPPRLHPPRPRTRFQPR